VNVQEILRALVAIPTPSALSNTPLIDWVAAFVEAKGWATERHSYTDDNGIAKANLIARPASADPAAPIDLAFVCHSDTVPFAADWAEALALTPSSGGTMLHGRGSCDVKGALACFLTALGSQAPNANVALIVSADEEIGCKGMDRLLAAKDLRIRSAIVSEPTSLAPGVAGKGYGLARVRIDGIEAHSAFPREGISAISVAARFIVRMEQLVTRWASAGDPLFDPPRTTLNVGTIEGGTAKNVVAGACSFLVEWRPVPADPPRSVLAELEWIADQIRMEEPHAHIHIDPLRAEPGFAPKSEGPLFKRLAAASPQPRVATGICFGSEASRLARVAEEIVVIGPGDMHTAHSSRECVPVAELDEWTATLSALLYSN
jgi:acetylornithine deacetylase